jgi:iron complex outermembrane receptor protein
MQHALVVRILGVWLAVATLGALLPAESVADEPSKSYNIASQDLGSALREFARQSNTETLFSSEVVKGKTTQGVHGLMTADSALSQLLTGTGLSFARSPNGSVLISMSDGKGPSSGPPNPPNATKEDARSSRSIATRGGDNLEEIVVTGSRIAQPGYNTPSPVSVTDAAQIERVGVSNAYDLLNRSPVFGTGVGAAEAAGDYTGEIGASFVNLRGLGINRALVLVNGERRVSGSSKTSAVDLSSIPANMIERIEVVTGGAAAVYGADAVSGAVNVILRDKVDGLEVNGRGGISSHGDAGSYTAGILGGGKLGDGGHISFGLSYNHEDALFQNQRDFSRNYVNLYANAAATGSNAFQNIAYNNSRFPNTTYSGAFYIGGNDAAHHYTYDNGTLRLVQNDSLPLPFLGIGGDGFNGADFNGLRPESSVLSALEHLTYELGGGITLTQDVQFSYNHSIQELQPLFGFAYPIARDNPYLPAPVAALMDANGVTTLNVGRTDTDQGRNNHDVVRETFTVVTKLDGAVTPTIAWQVYGQYGRFDDRDLFANERILSRYADALDVIQGSNGPECRSPTARANGCQPLDIFGLNVATPQALAYFHYNPTTYATNTQTVFGAQLNGTLVSMPAGPAKFSVGAEYRRETTAVRADGLATEGALFYGHGTNLTGDFDVREEFGELHLPLLSDAPMAKSLDINAAVRESEYSTIGRTFTWKAGLVYAPVNDVHLRLTQSRSVRAPNLSELFSSGALSQSADNYQDPCDITQINATPYRAANCYALGIPHGYTDPNAGKLRFVNISGNTALRAETSDSTTVGVVVQPRGVPGLSGSVDYYTMRIKEAINELAVNDVLTGCYDGPTPNAALCSLIVRARDNSIPYVKLVPLNIGALNARGIDASADYRFSAGSVGGTPVRLGASFVGNYDLTNDAVINEAQGTVLHYAGSAKGPHFRGNLTFSADTGSTAISWTARFISRSKVDLNVPANYRNDNNLTARLYNDLYIRRDLADRVSLGFGVNNIFNIKPPFSFDTYTGTGESGAIYDNIGTYFFGNVYAKF